MRSHVPLAQFMPYGAPELLESSRPHLTRALLLSSTIGVALFLAMLGAAASGWFAARVVIAPLPSRVVVPFVDPLPLPPSLRPRQGGPVAPAKDRSGPPVAVPDARAEIAVDWNAEGAIEGDDGPSPLDVAEPGPDIVVDPGPPRTFEAHDVDEQPVSMHPLTAHYPDLAREAGVEGLVVVRVLVGPEGRVKEAVIFKSVPMLDEAALEAARRATFQPALVNNHPVSCWVAVPFRFRLR